MEYLGNLVIIGIAVMLEVKFDEQIRANVSVWTSSKLMHSIWQNLGRVILVMAIVWNQPNDPQIIAVATGLMYGLFYWVMFDTVFAKGVMNQKVWYLGTSSAPDKWFPKWSHPYVWGLKLVAFGGSVWWVLMIG